MVWIGRSFVGWLFWDFSSLTCPTTMPMINYFKDVREKYLNIGAANSKTRVALLKGNMSQMQGWSTKNTNDRDPQFLIRGGMLVRTKTWDFGYRTEFNRKRRVVYFGVGIFRGGSFEGCVSERTAGKNVESSARRQSCERKLEKIKRNQHLMRRKALEIRTCVLYCLGIGAEKGCRSS